MRKRLYVMTLGVLIAGRWSDVAAQATHVVRMIAGPAKESYRFEPAQIKAKPNDVLIFRVGSGAPHSITFEEGGLSPAAHAALNAAMPGRSADLSSPLLTATGKEYRMIVPQLQPRTYPFYCLPKRAYDMRGELEIER